MWPPFGALVVFHLNFVSGDSNENFFRSFFGNNVMLSTMRWMSGLWRSIRWQWTISTVIVVWGIASQVSFVRNVSIIAIMITLLGVLSLSGWGVMVIVRGAVARSVTFVTRRGVHCVKVSILGFNSFWAATVILLIWVTISLRAFLSLLLWSDLWPGVT